jgi:hypothetical protein
MDLGSAQVQELSMKRFLAALGAMFVGLASFAVVVAVAPSASAYPAPVFGLSVDHQVLVGGNPFTATATSSVDCTSWTLRFLDQTATGTGKQLVHKFATPVVQDKTVYPVTATCTYTEASGAAGTAIQVRTATWDGQVPITLLPQGASGVAGPSAGGNHQGTGDHNGILPGTGGPSFWALLGAVLLVLAGLTAMVRSRRRGTPAT